MDDIGCEGVILMCSKDFEFQKWELQGEEFDIFSDHWWNRVENYYREYH